HESVRHLLSKQLDGPVVMLNLLRFRAQADYQATPNLAPEEPITGRVAYKLYMVHTAPFLAEAGGRVLWAGDGGAPIIGPMDERWDRVLLVEHQSVQAFLSFAQNDAYLAGVGHRTAALADSRLLPLTALPIAPAT
ncbi:MAG: DUF1330 domain-containing protein, partial [Myxococcota bacterium]